VRLIAFAIGVAIVSSAVAGVARLGAGQPPADPPQNAFVGAQICASCHPQIHATWSSGRHSKMLQRATAASVVGDFSKGWLTLRGGRYRVRSANGEYFITESYLTGKEQEHRIEYTLGSRRIQHYLTTIEKGRIVILPPTWDVTRQEWFPNLDIVRPDETQLTLVQQWNKNCVGCHVSQQEKNYRPATDDYATHWVDFGTSCERCHGPGKAHVDRYQQPQRATSDAGPSIVRPTRLDAKTSSMICAQCHSLRNAVYPGYTAGQNYYDYFVPVLEYAKRVDTDPAYWPDGRPRRFSNDAIGLWQSACFRRGGATCTTCHFDPHDPNIDRNPQLAPSNNALCTRCHQQIGASLTAHTRHEASSAGSACVECHMPRTVLSIKAKIRDHSMSVPAPENTDRFGIPNACTECHTDRKPSWAVETLAKWWPNGRRGQLIERAQTFTAARARQADALEPLLAIAHDDSAGPLIQATALGYLRFYPQPEAEAALVAGSKASDPALRDIAISSLGERGLQSAASRAAVLAALDDRQRGVRMGAFISLLNNVASTNPADIGVDRFQRGAREFLAYASQYQDDAPVQRDVGLIQLLRGDVPHAASALEIALRLDDSLPSAKFLLALARLNEHRPDAARVLLRQVPRTDPYYGPAQERLKTIDSIPR